MSQTINCSSCGAVNQLPEGKNSMFCAFCGTSNQIIITPIVKEVESNIKAKPEISLRDGKLSIINRNINSLNELVQWFSDNELSEIKILDLSKNNIQNLKELDRFISLEEIYLQNNEIESIEIFSNNIFKIKKIDLSNNNIKSLKGLSNFDLNNGESNCEINLSNNDIVYFDDLPCNIKKRVNINLSNNKNLIGFYEDIIDKISNLPINTIELNLKGCNNFDYKNIDYFINTVKYVKIVIYVDDDKNIPSYLLNIGHVQHPNVWEYPKPKLNPPSIAKKKSACFIATATMGSYEHPTVIDLRHFRDNWILKKSWGEDFVNWYYKYGEKAAKFIEKDFVLKKISYLIIVKPLHLFSKLINKKSLKKS